MINEVIYITIFTFQLLQYYGHCFFILSLWNFNSFFVLALFMYRINHVWYLWMEIVSQSILYAKFYQSSSTIIKIYPSMKMYTNHSKMSGDQLQIDKNQHLLSYHPLKIIFLWEKKLTLLFNYAFAISNCLITGACWQRRLYFIWIMHKVKLRFGCFAIKESE